RRVVEQQPPVAVEAVEPVVALVAERLEHLDGLRPLAASRDEVDVVVGSRQERRSLERDRDRKTAEQAQMDPRRPVEDASRLAHAVVLGHDDALRPSAGTLLASTAAAVAIPCSAATVGSSCSMEIVSTPRSASTDRKLRHQAASWPRPTVANVQGARGSVGDQRLSSSPLTASSSSLKTTSLACAWAMRGRAGATGSGSIRCQRRWLGSRFAARLSEIAASRSNVSALCTQVPGWSSMQISSPGCSRRAKSATSCQ